MALLAALDELPGDLATLVSEFLNGPDGNHDLETALRIAMQRRLGQIKHIEPIDQVSSSSDTTGP